MWCRIVSGHEDFMLWWSRQYKLLKFYGIDIRPGIGIVTLGAGGKQEKRLFGRKIQHNYGMNHRSVATLP